MNKLKGLFDSILRDYPIGTFLFWLLTDDSKNNYTFYKFLPNYHERDQFRNELAPRFTTQQEIIGILDGQQRLSSIYIALQGFYTYRMPYARVSWSDIYKYPKRKLYLNLFYEPESGEEDLKYQFKFLTEDECKKIDDKKFWFHVEMVIAWKDGTEVEDFYDESLKQYKENKKISQKLEFKKKNLKKILSLLFNKIHKEELISYFEIKDKKMDDMDDILDIFARVNSGGTILSKSDLIFSTIVAYWEDAREKMDDLLRELNQGRGSTFKFTNDWITQCLLFITNNPVALKLENFKKEAVVSIKNQWKEISKSFIETANLLTVLGFHYKNITSYRAIMPVVYYMFHNNTRLEERSKQDIRQYLLFAMLKQLFGRNSESLLGRLRKSIKNFQDSFNFSNIKEELPLTLAEEDIEKILDSENKQAAYLGLLLLYPDLKYSQKEFHVDHIHPDIGFSDDNLQKKGIPDNELNDYKEKKNSMANFQLLEGRENESKNKTPFKDWFESGKNSAPQNEQSKEQFKKDHYIPDTDLSFKNFFKI